MALEDSGIRKVAELLRQSLYYFSLFVLATLLFKFNYPLTPQTQFLIRLLCYFLMGLYVFQALSLILYRGFRILQSYELIVKVVILGALAITYTQPDLAAGLIILEEVFRGIRHFMRTASVARFFDRLRTQPELLLSSSFALIIAAGAILLSLPVATVGKQILFVDALFMATSATCVTGLAVQDTGSFFTPFGQAVLVLLMQLGGLGIMTMSTSLAMVIGKRLSIRERLFMQNVMEETDYQEFRRILGSIFKMTFVIEGIGALLLTARFYVEQRDVFQSIGYGVFHAISAFCNAGLGLLANSFENYYGDPLINLTISFLIIFGGLGFSVVHGLVVYRSQPKPRQMNLHLKMTLSVTLLLLFGGTLFIFLTEYSGALIHLSLGQKLWVSWFQSVTLRTAGFNTWNLTTFSSATLFMMMIFMFIGGSPGSTAGGIKTTTVGVLFFTVRSMISGRESVQAFHRTIPWDIIRKSISITFIAGGIVVVGFLGLAMIEPFSFQEILFEVVSAFGTVGLSLGITPKLSSLGKLIIISLMYMGRIGPLTVALLMAKQRPGKGYDLPTGKIVVG